MKIILAVAASILLMTSSQDEALKEMKLFPSELPVGDELPPNTEALIFEKIERTTKYRFIQDQDDIVLEANANNSASAILFKVNIEQGDLKEDDLAISWRWKVSSSVANGDLRTKKSDDAAARVYVLFEYNPSYVSKWMQIKYGLAKQLYGSYPPHATLNYVWGNKMKQGEQGVSAYTDRSHIIVLQDNSSKQNQWIEERIYPYRDYKLAFEGAIPKIVAIGVMSDTDNTDSKVTAWYADLQVEIATGNENAKSDK